MSCAIVPLLALVACTGTPRGVEAVPDFDLDRYLGRWYEIARLDHSFERGLVDVTADYSVREEGGLRVVNRGFDAQAGEWRAIEGRARSLGDPSVGELAVTFFGPFYGGYNVIDLDHERYAWALVAGPTRSFLWILARVPDPAPEVVQALIDRAALLDFPVDELIRVPHGVAPEPAN
ncbi:MAG: lipocalin family protein [Myxococcota bacterium]